MRERKKERIIAVERKLLWTNNNDLSVYPSNNEVIHPDVPKKEGKQIDHWADSDIFIVE